MVSLQKITSRGYTYWRIVESKRVGGKPRPVPILHLGTPEQLLKRLTEAPTGILRLKSYEHGPAAVTKALADRLQIAKTIDKHAPPSRHAQSVGTTIELAILNRAIHPTSKNAWADWANTTSLHRLYPGLDLDQLTSQYFWDQMDLLDEAALENIEAELTKRVVEDQGLELDTLFFDATNFFTYIATTNTRNKTAKRGHNKQKRHDLRQVSLALLVSRDGHIPLAHRVYEGNKVDVSEFPAALTMTRKRLEQVTGGVEDVTVVYDRGNNSITNQDLVDESRIGYVAGLNPHQHQDLLDIPAKKYEPLESEGSANGIPAYRLDKEIWGTKRTVVMFISDKLQQGQIRGLDQHLTKALTALEAWRAKLASPRAGPRTPGAAEQRIKEITSAQHVRKVLTVTYDPSKTGSKRLEWRLDEQARERLETELFGKRFLMTNRGEWSTAQIVEAYHGQAHVERSFRSLKDSTRISIRPQYHWTDQKVRVQVFICLAALLLTRVLEREAQARGWHVTGDSLLRELANVRLAMVLRAPGPKGGRPKADWMLEEAAPATMEAFRAWVPEGAV